MPRTKRPVARKAKVEVDDDTKKIWDSAVIDMKSRFDARQKMEERNIELAFRMLIESLSVVAKSKTIGQQKNELNIQENHTHSRKTRNSAARTSLRGSNDDAPPSTMSSQRQTRRSRSADASSRKLPPSVCKTMVKRRSRSVYKTPAYKSTGANYPAITPKVAPHTPLTVLRQPRQGEMVVSMSGSPVFVPTYNNMVADEKANCNIMLQDGTLLSLQPQELRQSQTFLPYSLIGDNVLQQLKMLRVNLDKVVKLGERAKK